MTKATQAFVLCVWGSPVVLAMLCGMFSAGALQPHPLEVPKTIDIGGTLGSLS